MATGRSKRRRCRSEVIQADVIARHLAGHSNSKIVRDLGICRSTVAVILATADIGNYVRDEGLQTDFPGMILYEANCVAKHVADWRMAINSKIWRR